jgi:nuclear pore complex protein Nup107
MLHGWLQYPKDGRSPQLLSLTLQLIAHSDKEADEFERIRIACIPEVILAYNTVLNYSGYSISRDILLKCMDLAALIAAEGSDLAASFVAAGRMPELVESLALSSRNMIQAEERGFRPGKSRRKPNGERLDLWIIKPPPT